MPDKSGGRTAYIVSFNSPAHTLPRPKPPTCAAACKSHTKPFGQTARLMCKNDSNQKR